MELSLNTTLDNLPLCIGYTGFDTDMGALRELGPAGNGSEAMRCASACMNAIGAEFADPTYRLRFWSKVTGAGSIVRMRA